MLKARIEQDLKKALLAGEKERATTLRSIKSAILYAEVSKGTREQGLDDDAIIEVLSREAKKRQESIDLYEKAGDQTRAQAERSEKAIIDAYLPQQLSDEELGSVIGEVIAEQGASSMQDMGKVIAAVKQKTAGQADGGRIAGMVKERLSR